VKKPRVLAVIPARLGSRRFSRKVLYPYKDRPLLWYLYREVSRAKLIDKTVIATDSIEIQQVAENFGAEVVLTSKRHRTGSDRVAQAAAAIGGEIVLNIQGDNVGLKAVFLDGLVKRFQADRTTIFGTVVNRIDDDDDLNNSNTVKAVMSADGRALWFSRSVLPFLQGVPADQRLARQVFWHHIGIYLFRRAGLEAYAGWKRTPLEKAESLEQLRILEHGGFIRVYKTRMRTVSIDSPEDIAKVAAFYG